jgi:TIR domain
MSKLFISHSSVDKDWVRKLAIGLLHEGFPVWLDEWELDLGESLIERIYSGIDQSTYFLLVMSEASVKSGWVTKELNAALVKEEQLSRKFLIPILVGDCKVPLQVGDRLYADFSKGYLVAFETLCKWLGDRGLHEAPLDPSKVLVPLSFSRGIHLDSGSLKRDVGRLLATLSGEFRFTPRNFILSPDQGYRLLRHRLTERMDNLANDSYYSHEFEHDFRGRYRLILSREEKLLEGIALILNELVMKRGNKLDRLIDPAEVCRWFGLFWRSSILYLLWDSQNPDLEEPSDYGRDCIWCETGSDARFYGVEELGKIDVGPMEDNAWVSGSFGVWIDARSSAYVDTWHYGYSTPNLVIGNCDINDMSKYIVPQMVARIMLELPLPGPYTWDFKDYWIGRA